MSGNSGLTRRAGREARCGGFPDVRRRNAEGGWEEARGWRSWCRLRAGGRMMARRGAFGILAGGALALLLSTCWSKTKTFRYKMTVEVETPEGAKTGTSVREIALTDSLRVPMIGEDRGSSRLRGEAVVVDIAQNSSLFVLLTNSRYGTDYGTKEILSLFNKAEFQSDNSIELWPIMPVISGRSPKYHNQDAVLPMLVGFKDIDDPASVFLVKPNDLATHFGSGVSLSRIRIEATDESVTERIGERLNWLDEHQGILLRSADWRERSSHPERFQTVEAFVQRYEK